MRIPETHMKKSPGGKRNTEKNTDRDTRMFLDMSKESQRRNSKKQVKSQIYLIGEKNVYFLSDIYFRWTQNSKGKSRSPPEKIRRLMTINQKLSGTHAGPTNAHRYAYKSDNSIDNAGGAAATIEPGKISNRSGRIFN